MKPPRKTSRTRRTVSRRAAGGSSSSRTRARSRSRSREALKRAGFEPVVAPTAAQALDLAERLEPDLVLLDLRLPDGDGRDVCRAASADAPTCRS